MMVNPNKSPRKNYLKVGMLLLAALLLVFIALPNLDNHYSGFKDNMQQIFGRDVSMFGVGDLNATEGSYLFFPGSIEKLVAFSRPTNSDSLAFYRDNSLSLSPQGIEVKDKFGSLLTVVPLGSSVSVSFVKSPL